MLKKCRFIPIIAAVLLWLPSLHAATGTVVEANRLTRQLVRKKMQEQRIPAVQIAVVRNQRIVLSETWGLANVENHIAAKATTLFPINSATKSFTGVAMMQLAEAGLVDLEAPVSRYLDDVPEAWRSIRIRQLLGHTSGLPDVVDQKGMLGGGTERAAWEAVKKLPLDAPVGERFSYNQTNYGLLQQIIAKQAKTPFEHYVAQHQFAVAKMPLTTFGDSYDLVPDAATIYATTPRGTLAANDGDRLSKWIYEIPYGLWAGGGMQTTADEVARWIIALSDGRLISNDDLQKMWVPERLNNGANGDWAAGWPVLHAPPQRQVAGIGGARAAFVVYPDDGLAIVVLTNLAGANPQRFIGQIAAFYNVATIGNH
ncbi:MAG: serine hydrolase domain-containing protein [Dokdonella sp.]|uniref:serine hydrolase domain-containing protein n=1 Tax=Dokdonella sp. TaxID=2291710 RepID=UPI0032679DB3